MKTKKTKPPTLPILELWEKKVSACNTCPIAAYSPHKVMYRYRRLGSIDIVLVGEAPGDKEYADKTPFVGPAGHELEYILNETIHKTNYNYLITNAILCTPWDSEWRATYHTPLSSEITACRGHLHSLLTLTQPALVIALGRVAERSVKKIGCNYIHVMHPSGVMQSSHKEYDRERVILAINAAMEKYLCSKDI